MQLFFEYWYEQRAVLLDLASETVSLLLAAFFMSLVAGSLIGLLLAGLRQVKNPIVQLVAVILRFIVMVLGDYPFIILLALVILFNYSDAVLPFEQMIQLLLMGWGALRFAYYMLQNLIDRSEEDNFALHFIHGSRQLAISLVSAVIIAGIMSPIGMGQLLYDGFSQRDMNVFIAGVLLVMTLVIIIELIFAIILFQVRQRLHDQRQVSAQSQDITFVENTLKQSACDNDKHLSKQLLEEQQVAHKEKREVSKVTAKQYETTRTRDESSQTRVRESDPFSKLIQ